MDNQQSPQTPPPGQPSQPAQGTGDKEVQIGKYKVKVVRSLCIGAASCVAVSPSVFQLDNENKAVVQESGNDVPENKCGRAKLKYETLNSKYETNSNIQNSNIKKF